MQGTDLPPAGGSLDFNDMEYDPSTIAAGAGVGSDVLFCDERITSLLGLLACKPYEKHKVLIERLIGLLASFKDTLLTGTDTERLGKWPVVQKLFNCFFTSVTPPPKMLEDLDGCLQGAKAYVTSTLVSNKRTNSNGSIQFSSPSKRKIAKQQTLTEIRPPPLLVNNPFDTLHNDPENPVHDDDVEDGNMDNSDQENSDQDTSTAPPISPNRPEPFHISMEGDWQTTIQNIFNHIGTKLKQKIVGDFVKIFPTSVDQFRAIQSYLGTHKIKAYCVNLRSERPKKVILKGLPKDTPIDNIRTALEAEGFVLVNIVQLKRWDRDLAAKRPIPAFIVHLRTDPGWENIYAITEMFDFTVSVSSFKSKGPKQCYNCQRYNHSSQTCQLDPVCMKCSLKHRTIDCKKSKDTPAKCGLCKGPHPANYRLCPFHPDQIRARKDKGKTPTIQQAAQPVQQIPPHATFAAPPTGVLNYSSALQYRPPSLQNTISQSNPQPTAPPQNVYVPPQVTTPVATQPTPPVTPLPPVTSQALVQMDLAIARLDRIADLLRQIEQTCTRLKITNFDMLLQFISSDTNLIQTPSGHVSFPPAPAPGNTSTTVNNG